jgi:hypothetical protein
MLFYLIILKNMQYCDILFYMSKTANFYQNSPISVSQQDGNRVPCFDCSADGGNLNRTRRVSFTKDTLRVPMITVALGRLGFSHLHALTACFGSEEK